MRFSTASLLAFSSVALAAPSSPAQRRDLTYDASNPPQIFTDLTCKLSKSLTPGEPLSFAFPLADHLGTIITPALNTLVGHESVNDLDIVADNLCVNAQQDPHGGNGICQDSLQSIRDFVDAKTPLAQAQGYRCLLNLLCVAHTGVPYNSLCDYLLAGVDCIANRIIGVTAECT
ncbi:hypothetical protein BU16DRAFT_613754 [Lophium mytilinum]|uniref:Uncharacterized protein n=1 Tax=Lophium mytilinum TaxID=390894 RepID=A0A6A6R855_9PEZI|nr:hypothetical protein BU16DRAFT_613754 [Lophium mytilinum]